MNEIHSRIVDIERICRLCLQEKRILMNIFEATEENYSLSIYQKIKACATVDIFRGDGLPTRICVPCLSSLNAAFDFRIQCENADRTLHNNYHLLISDKEKETLKITSNIEKEEVECEESEPKHLQFIDPSHVILIKRQNKYITQENNSSSGDDEKEKEQETEDLLTMIHVVKNNQLSDNIIKDDLMSINTEPVMSSDSLDVVFESEKMENEISFPLENTCLKVASGMKLYPEKQMNAGNINEKAKIETTGNAKKSACPFCHKMLTRVNEHIRLFHQNKVYICEKPNCGAEFLTLKNLQSHQLKCYNMEKPYKCLRCFKEFHRKCNYKAHIIRHSNKRDFQCQLCDKAFVDSTGLKRHFLKHHEPQQETFISTCCDKKFKTKEGLKHHVLKGICGVQIFQILDSNN